MVIYDRYDIVFQEVPNEVSLAFTLKNCPNMCEGCHSPHLRETTGAELTTDVLKEAITRNRGITTVLFLGGDKDPLELIELFDYVKYCFDLKVAWYSGNDDLVLENISHLDYYKYGRYDKELGGLDSVNTNQKMLLISNGSISNITNKFWK